MQAAIGFSVVLLCAVFAADTISGREGTPPEEGRDLRDYNQDWTAVGFFPSPQDTSWAPPEQLPKRRRIRKRKRRPPVFDSTVEIMDEEPSRKRARPQRLDEIKEPWEEMSSETSQKSYNRRRLTPIFDETVEIAESRTQNYEKIRDPFTALQEAEEKQKKKMQESSAVPDLKTILKQNGGISLSEVLQQKNLSLAELLNGNQQAISALARKAESTTEATTEKSRRTLGLRKTTDRNFLRSTELSSREVHEAQRKRLALLQRFPDVHKVEVVTEATTEKRIFVATNTKHHTAVDYQQKTTPVPTEVSSSRPQPKKLLPITSAKLNKMMPKPVQEDSPKIPAKAVTINVNEIFGFSLFDKKNKSDGDGPLKMTIDIEELATTQFSREEAKTVSPFSTQEELKITTMVSVGTKISHVTAKEEIMEILKNPIEREYLARILKTRNMTVDELVQQRERGSSQLHLADIFHNETREPEPQDEPFVGHIQSENIPLFNRQAKNRFFPTITTSSTPSTTKSVEETTMKPLYTITSFPTYKIESNKNVKLQPPFLPVWKQLYPSFFPEALENNRQEDRTEIVRFTTEQMNDDDLERFEDIENTLAEATNGRLNADLNQNVYDEEFIRLPSGVKSAILASMAIIGLSLLVFLTILVIFKWSQKQRRTYSDSFSGKVRSPILGLDQKRSFRTFVSETLGRKKNYYKTHLQSMSDSIWDNGNEKKSYMI